RELGRAEGLGIVERADLHHDDRPWRARDEVRAAFGAKLACDRTLEVLARELLGRSLGVAEGLRPHQHEHVGRPACDVLAFPAMALRLHHRFAVDDVAHGAAIASTFGLHGFPPDPPRGSAQYPAWGPSRPWPRIGPRQHLNPRARISD